MKILILAFVCAFFPDPAPTIQWGGAHCGVEDIRIELIEDAESLAEAWRLTHGGSNDGLPQVNFDRCRLVLALRGREMDVQRVIATEISRSQQEAILTIDAGLTSRVEDQKPEETTAWGLFIIPRRPEVVRVRYNASEDLGGEPQWETITVLGQDADRPEPDGQRPSRQAQPREHGDGQHLVPDLSLLQPRRQSDRDEDVEGDPYVAMFQKGDKELLFVAARHEQDIEHDPTHRLVRMAMEQFRPQVAIIEGVPTSEGPQPERFIANARRRVKSGRASEGMYAAVLAG